MGNIVMNYCLSRKKMTIKDKRIIYLKYELSENKFENNNVEFENNNVEFENNNVEIKNIDKNIDNIYRI